MKQLSEEIKQMLQEKAEELYPDRDDFIHCEKRRAYMDCATEILSHPSKYIKCLAWVKASEELPDPDIKPTKVYIVRWFYEGGYMRADAMAAGILADFVKHNSDKEIEWLSESQQNCELEKEIERAAKLEIASDEIIKNQDKEIERLNTLIEKLYKYPFQMAYTGARQHQEENWQQFKTSNNL